MLCCGMKIIQDCLRGQPEKTNLKITCGKPIYVVTYKTIKIITTVTALLALIIIIDCIGIFIKAVKLKLTIGVLINMISKNEGNFLPAVYVIPALLCLLLSIGMLCLAYVAFSPESRRFTNAVMYIVILISLVTVVIIFLVCIIILAHVYAANDHLHNGIIDAMKNYSTQSDIKQQIDMMQIEYQCCGSKKYDEWYDIEWYDTNLVKSEKRLEGTTPFSCCSMSSIFPCIHHGIEATGSIYLYRPETNLSISTHGCFMIVKKKRQIVGWKIIGKLLQLIALMLFVTMGFRFLQTAHFDKSKFVGHSRLYTIWLLGCYTGKIRESISLSDERNE